jgi:nucleotide-binding universal stress UspA family protein
MNILITLDSSPTAQAALEAALARRWPPATEFRVLTVLPQKAKWTNNQEGTRSSVPNAYTLVDDAANKVEARNPDSIATAQFDEGDPAKCILKYAREWPADLIIVGSHDRSLMERMFMGSVSRAVFQDADCSVLIARKVEPSQVYRVLVPIDDSFNSQIAVDTLLASRWPENTYFKLVSAGVVDHGLFGDQSDVELHEEYFYGINETLQKTKAKLDVHFGPEFVDCLMREGEPAPVILDTAKEWDAHLIVIGASERPGITLKVFGSLAQTVALKAPCSVFAVRLTAPMRSRISNAQRWREEARASGPS